MFSRFYSLAQRLHSSFTRYGKSFTSSIHCRYGSYMNSALNTDPALLLKQHQILPGQTELAIHWQTDALSNNFHALWLRHQCHCNICTHLTSGQRFIEPHTLCSPVVIHNAEPTDDRVELEWENSEGEKHQGFVPLKWLHLHRSHHEDSHEEEPLQLKEMEYDYILSSEHSLYNYLYALNKYGVVKVVGAPNGAVLKIADAVAHRFDSVWGREFDYGLKIDPTTLAFSNKPLYYHIDLPYMQNKPGIAYLHCLRYDDCVEGGVLTVKDGFNIAKAFKKKFPEHFRTLSTVLVKHNFISSQRETYYMREATHFVVTEDGELREVNWAPNIQHSISDTSNGDMMHKYANAYHQFNEFIQDFSEKVDIRYKRGDIAIFHNLRMLHTRNALYLNGGVRHIHGCYSPIDEYRSKIRSLGLKLGMPMPNKIW